MRALLCGTATAFAIGLFAYRVEHAPLSPLPPLRLQTLSTQEVDATAAREVPLGSSPEHVEEWMKRRNLYGKWWYQGNYPQPPRYSPELAQAIDHVAIEFGGSDPRSLAISFKDDAVDDIHIAVAVS